jgi:hypothetical protein
MGVLWWLPDLDAWAEVVTGLLVPGGRFYLHEIHPIAACLSDRDGHLEFGEDYFGDGGVIVFETTATYYQAPADFAAEPGMEHGWLHPLGEIITALCRAGLRIEYLREWPDAHFRMLPSFERGADGRWHPPPGTRPVPLTFSLLASRT